MIDTSCRKCKTPMVEAMYRLPYAREPLTSVQFTLTGYLCKKCGHWNDLKRRKDTEASGRPRVVA